MKRSMAASVVAWAEAKRWSRAVLEKCVDAWICPSQFMARKMEQGGFDSGKLKVLCNFVDPLKLEKFKAQHEQPRDDFYCYVGRLSAEKGVSTLLQAAALMRREVRVGGSGPLIDELRHDFSSFPNIHFLGQLDAQGVSDLLGRARFSVVPSEWYENNPLSVIESLCSGTPVVGSHIGGIPELIVDGCGLTYPCGDAKALCDAMRQAWNTGWDHDAIKHRAIERFSPEAHYAQLQAIYDG